MSRYALIRNLQTGLLVLALVVCGTAAPMSAMADLVPTQDLLAGEQMDAGRDRLRSLFAREEVRSALTGMGVNVDSAAERVDAMTDAEVMAVAEQMDSMPAGSSALGTIALVLVILILLDVAGVTDIFPAV